MELSPSLALAYSRAKPVWMKMSLLLGLSMPPLIDQAEANHWSYIESAVCSFYRLEHEVMHIL